MKMSPNNMLPLNDLNLEVQNHGKYSNTELFLTGDIRGNENPALTSLHTVFVREHNRLASEFKLANDSLTDEELFQKARKFNIAYLQAITEMEYIPAILGQVLVSFRLIT